MKKTKKPIATLVMALAMAVTMLAIPASANNTDHAIAFFINNVSYTDNAVAAQEKEDSSAVYLNITQMDTSYCYVRVCGDSERLSALRYPCTCLKSGVAVANVTCFAKAYSVHSLVNERGYKYAQLQFKASNAETYIKGVWSVDSVGTYTDAT